MQVNNSPSFGMSYAVFPFRNLNGLEKTKIKEVLKECGENRLNEVTEGALVDIMEKKPSKIHLYAYPDYYSSWKKFLKNIFDDLNPLGDKSHAKVIAVKDLDADTLLSSLKEVRDAVLKKYGTFNK
jgi:hypothetical protein